MDRDNQFHCPVCMETIDAEVQTLATLRDCLHKFCFDCLCVWFVDHETCPVCLQKCISVTKQTKKEAESEEVSFADFVTAAKSIRQEATKDKKEEQKLDCIDHTYVLAEIRKLSSRFQHAQQRIKCYANRQVFDGKVQMAMKNIEWTLADLKHNMESFAEFDPEYTLPILYDIEFDLTKIINGSDSSILRFAKEYDEEGDYGDYNDDYNEGGEEEDYWNDADYAEPTVKVKDKNVAPKTAKANKDQDELTWKVTIKKKKGKK